MCVKINLDDAQTESNSRDSMEAVRICSIEVPPSNLDTFGNASVQLLPF